jgi:hypothetical protein
MYRDILTVFLVAETAPVTMHAHPDIHPRSFEKELIVYLQGEPTVRVPQRVIAPQGRSHRKSRRSTSRYDDDRI